MQLQWLHSLFQFVSGTLAHLNENTDKSFSQLISQDMQDCHDGWLLYFVLHAACCLCIHRLAQLCCCLTYLQSERQLNCISSHFHSPHWFAHLAQREVYLRLSYASSVCGVSWTYPSMTPRNMVLKTKSMC